MIIMLEALKYDRLKRKRDDQNAKRNVRRNRRETKTMMNDKSELNHSNGQGQEKKTQQTYNENNYKL